MAFSAEVSGEGWRKLVEAGITPANRAAELPGFGVKLAVPVPPDTRCALIELETPGQPSDFRVTLQNFFVLTRYNRSNLYAAAVMDLATELARARSGPPAPQPNPSKEDS